MRCSKLSYGIVRKELFSGLTKIQQISEAEFKSKSSFNCAELYIRHLKDIVRIKQLYFCSIEYIKINWKTSHER